MSNAAIEACSLYFFKMLECQKGKEGRFVTMPTFPGEGALVLYGHHRHPCKTCSTLCSLLLTIEECYRKTIVSRSSCWPFFGLHKGAKGSEIVENLNRFTWSTNGIDDRRISRNITFNVIFPISILAFKAFDQLPYQDRSSVSFKLAFLHRKSIIRVT